MITTTVAIIVKKPPKADDEFARFFSGLTKMSRDLMNTSRFFYILIRIF